MASIVFDRVEKSFGDFRAVRRLSLDIQDGEFVAFLGPSGCGKTTCLRMLAGLETPSAGRIILGDDDVTYRSPRQRDVAMVFQNYALYPHMSARENIVMGLKYRGVARADIAKRVAEAAALLDIAPLLDRKPAELSGGQRQRVALGRAIVRHPQAFLMDEPLSNLDTALRSKMRVELKMLHQRVKTTTIYVTHDQIEAMTMADRIAVMLDGTLMQFDTPDRIFNEPANRFVAQFVGAPAINLVPGRLATALGGVDLDVLGARVSIPAGRIRTSSERVDVGIRPQALTLATQGAVQFTNGRVAVMEPIGTQTHVHVAVGDTTLVTVADPREAPRLGDTVEIGCAREDIYLFDAETGETLAHGI